jgi:hypothetical protein
MTVTVQNTAITNTFDFWRTQTNYLAAAMTNLAVTVNSNTAVGNAAISGTMTANLFSGNVAATLANLTTINATSIGTTNLLANTTNTYVLNTNTAVINTYITVGAVSINTNYISVGNSSVNVQLTVPTNTQITNSNNIFLLANSSWGPVVFPYTPISNGQTTTTGTSTIILDAYPMATYKGAEYLLNVTDNISNNHYTTKILTTHDGYNAYSAEYGQIITNTAIGIFFTDSNTTYVRLNFTPSITSTTVKFVKVNV